MEIATLKLQVANPAHLNKMEMLEFIVDSEAVYSVVPGAVLKRLRIKTMAKEEFRLADGSTMTRKKGVVLFKYGENKGGTDVIFGEDATLPGALTLEALGLVLDPLRRKLKPLPMILAHEN